MFEGLSISFKNTFEAILTSTTESLHNCVVDDRIAISLKKKNTYEAIMSLMTRKNQKSLS